MVDFHDLPKGDSYNELKETYIIFICRFDEFGDGKHIILQLSNVRCERKFSLRDFYEQC